MDELKFLIVEDNAADLRLIQMELSRGGVTGVLKQVETREDFLRALDEQKPTLIISDHGVAGFDGFAALDLARARCPNVPFIFVSGSNDQAMIIEMFERGATDYVFKLHLRDLAPAVRTALTRPPPAPDKPRGAAPASVLKTGTRLPTRQKSAAPPSSGPLEFCSRCNRVHSPEGRWMPLAEYLGLQGATNIAQAVCPECARAKSLQKG